MKERSLFIQKFERIAREDPRILSAFLGGSLADGTEDDFSDIDILRCSCLPEEADVPIDELACLVISRECKKVTHESLMERKRMRSIHDRKKAS